MHSTNFDRPRPRPKHKVLRLTKSKIAKLLNHGSKAQSRRKLKALSAKKLRKLKRRSAKLLSGGGAALQGAAHQRAALQRASHQPFARRHPASLRLKRMPRYHVPASHVPASHVPASLVQRGGEDETKYLSSQEKEALKNINDEIQLEKHISEIDLKAFTATTTDKTKIKELQTKFEDLFTTKKYKFTNDGGAEKNVTIKEFFTDVCTASHSIECSTANTAIDEFLKAVDVLLNPLTSDATFKDKQKTVIKVLFEKVQTVIDKAYITECTALGLVDTYNSLVDDFDALVTAIGSKLDDAGLQVGKRTYLKKTVEIYCDLFLQMHALIAAKSNYAKTGSSNTFLGETNSLMDNLITETTGTTQNKKNLNKFTEKLNQIKNAIQSEIKLQIPTSQMLPESFHDFSAFSILLGPMLENADRVKIADKANAEMESQLKSGLLTQFESVANINKLVWKVTPSFLATKKLQKLLVGENYDADVFTKNEAITNEAGTTLSGENNRLIKLLLFLLKELVATVESFLKNENRLTPRLIRVEKDIDWKNFTENLTVFVTEKEKKLKNSIQNDEGFQIVQEINNYLTNVQDNLINLLVTTNNQTLTFFQTARANAPAKAASAPVKTAAAATATAAAAASFDIDNWKKAYKEFTDLEPNVFKEQANFENDKTKMREILDKLKPLWMAKENDTGFASVYNELLNRSINKDGFKPTFKDARGQLDRVNGTLLNFNNIVLASAAAPAAAAAAAAPAPPEKLNSATFVVRENPQELIQDLKTFQKQLTALNIKAGDELPDDQKHLFTSMEGAIKKLIGKYKNSINCQENALKKTDCDTLLKDIEELLTKINVYVQDTPPISGGGNKFTNENEVNTFANLVGQLITKVNEIDQELSAANSGNSAADSGLGSGSNSSSGSNSGSNSSSTQQQGQQQGPSAAGPSAAGPSAAGPSAAGPSQQQGPAALGQPQGQNVSLANQNQYPGNGLPPGNCGQQDAFYMRMQLGPVLRNGNGLQQVFASDITGNSAGSFNSAIKSLDYNLEKGNGQGNGAQGQGQGNGQGQGQGNGQGNGQGQGNGAQGSNGSMPPPRKSVSGFSGLKNLLSTVRKEDYQLNAASIDIDEDNIKLKTGTLFRFRVPNPNPVSKDAFSQFKDLKNTFQKKNIESKTFTLYIEEADLKNAQFDTDKPILPGDSVIAAMPQKYALLPPNQNIDFTGKLKDAKYYLMNSTSGKKFVLLEQEKNQLIGIDLLNKAQKGGTAATKGGKKNKKKKGRGGGQVGGQWVVYKWDLPKTDNTLLMDKDFKILTQKSWRFEQTHDANYDPVKSGISTKMVIVTDTDAIKGKESKQYNALRKDIKNKLDGIVDSYSFTKGLKADKSYLLKDIPGVFKIQNKTRKLLGYSETFARGVTAETLPLVKFLKPVYYVDGNGTLGRQNNEFYMLASDVPDYVGDLNNNAMKLDAKSLSGSNTYVYKKNNDYDYLIPTLQTKIEVKDEKEEAANAATAVVENEFTKKHVLVLKRKDAAGGDLPEFNTTLLDWKEKLAIKDPPYIYSPEINQMIDLQKVPAGTKVYKFELKDQRPVPVPVPAGAPAPPAISPVVYVFDNASMPMDKSHKDLYDSYLKNTAVNGTHNYFESRVGPPNTITYTATFKEIIVAGVEEDKMFYYLSDQAPSAKAPVVDPALNRVMIVGFPVPAAGKASVDTSITVAPSWLRENLATVEKILGPKPKGTSTKVIKLDKNLTKPGGVLDVQKFEQSSEKMCYIFAKQEFNDEAGNKLFDDFHNGATLNYGGLEVTSKPTPNDTQFYVVSNNATVLAAIDKEIKKAAAAPIKGGKKKKKKHTNKMKKQSLKTAQLKRRVRLNRTLRKKHL
jgi:hypothetical protein